MRPAGRRVDFLTWRWSSLNPDSLNDLIAKICQIAGVPRATTHQFRHTLAVQWRKNDMKIETISRMLGHRSLRMTMRYAVVMPETVRREFDAALADGAGPWTGSGNQRVIDLAATRRVGRMTLLEVSR